MNKMRLIIFENLNFLLIIKLLIISINSQLPNNFHIPLTQSSTFSTNLNKIKVLEYQSGKVITNLTIESQTINIGDSALFEIKKSNTEISTSFSNLIEINNEEIYISKNDYFIEYIFTNSTIFSKKPLNSQYPDTQLTVSCKYIVNTPILDYSWINYNSAYLTAKYSYMTFILKKQTQGIFYLEFNKTLNQISEKNAIADNFDLNTYTYDNIWVIEQKYIDQDFLILGVKEKNNTNLFVFNVLIFDGNSTIFNFGLSLYTKISLSQDIYDQINKIGFYDNNFFLATRKKGIVILSKYLITNDINNFNWGIKTSITDFQIPVNNTSKRNKNENGKNNNYFSSFRNLQSETINNTNLSNETLSNNKTSTNNTLNPNNTTSSSNITEIPINILDFSVNEFTIYAIVQNRGLYIINLKDFRIVQDFFYYNPNIYKLEFYNNIFQGNKFLGIYSSNKNRDFQEIFVELLLDNELIPLVNKVFTSAGDFISPFSASYDNFFTFILNTKEKNLYIIRKAMINAVPYKSYKIDLNNIIKLDSDFTNFILLFDNVEKKIYYSLYNQNIIVPLNIIFTPDTVICGFSQPGKFELNFIQNSELCVESINSNLLKSFCEKNTRYVIEVIGPPTAEMQKVLTGFLISFVIMLILLFTFICFKTDGCKNMKYFKVKKSVLIRQRLYYDPGDDINIDSARNKDLLTQRIVFENESNKDVGKTKMRLVDSKADNQMVLSEKGKKLDFVNEATAYKIENLRKEINEDNFEDRISKENGFKNNLFENRNEENNNISGVFKNKNFNTENKIENKDFYKSISLNKYEGIEKSEILCKNKSKERINLEMKNQDVGLINKQNQEVILISEIKRNSKKFIKENEAEENENKNILHEKNYNILNNINYQDQEENNIKEENNNLNSNKLENKNEKEKINKDIDDNRVIDIDD